MNTEEYLRIPYRKNGRGWDGADCYGFVRLVLERETGFTAPLLDGAEAPEESFFDLYERLDEPEELAVVFLRGGPFREAHVGIYTGGALLHMTEKGVCCQKWKWFRGFDKEIYRPKPRL